MRLKTILLAATFLASAIGAASAHTAFLVPRDFTPDGDYASAEGAFATTFFTPEIGITSEDFHAIRPGGARGGFSTFGVGSQSTTMELSAHLEGTYRFSTGERVGVVNTLVGVDGAWRPLAEGETPPEGAPISTLQTVTVAETYVSKVRPTEDAYATPVGRLAIRPVTHPNRVSVADGLTLELLFDGQPFPNMPFVLYGQGDLESDLDRTFVTDAQGRATIRVDQPGVYAVVIRHRGDAPAGSQAQVHSYTTSLTFEAVSELPPIPPPPREERRRRRDR